MRGAGQGELWWGRGLGILSVVARTVHSRRNADVLLKVTGEGGEVHHESLLCITAILGCVAAAHLAVPIPTATCHLIPSHQCFLPRPSSPAPELPLSSPYSCVDLDCDNVVRPREMWFFYEEQLRRMENMPSGETVLFEDVVCQLHDMLQPEAEGAYTIRWGREHVGWSFKKAGGRHSQGWEPTR